MVKCDKIFDFFNCTHTKEPPHRMGAGALARVQGYTSGTM